MKKKIKILIRVLAIVVVVGVIGGSGYFLGFKLGKQQSEAVIIYRDTPEIDADFSLFWEAWKALKKQHYKSDQVTDLDLLYGAIRGLASAFKDPYTVLLTPEQAKILSEDLRGSFGGVGIEIGIREHQLTIIAPLSGTPADRAGLRSNDKIVEIDGESTRGITLEEAVRKIRGPKGEAVVLTIMREGWSSPKKFPIIRDTIIIPTLDWEMKDKAAYIRLKSFNQKAYRKFYQAARAITSKQPKGIILDLRNNPGGYLETSVDLAGFFLEKNSLVVKERFSDKHEQEFRTSREPILKDYPLVVLINQGSASASEILAGALRDHHRAKLVGEKTFGKGTVQQIRSLDESKLKISVAEWILPSGECINEKGIVPDIEVKLTEKDIKQNKDPQLDKAIEILNNL